MNTDEPGTRDAPMTLIQRLRKMLRLPETASDDDIADALESALSATPDPEKYVPIAAMQSVMDDRFERFSQQSEQRTETKVSDALAKGFITPAMKGWATALCAQNEASFDAFIAKSPAAFGHLTQSSHTAALAPSGSRKPAVERQGDAASVCRQLGLDETALG